MTRHSADIDRSEEWAELRARYLEPADQRPSSSARGVHHLALLSSDVERTIIFYQDLLEFPLTDLFENRDYQGSTHFFFDIGTMVRASRGGIRGMPEVGRCSGGRSQLARNSQRPGGASFGSRLSSSAR